MNKTWQPGRPYMQIQRAGHAASWAIEPITPKEAGAVKARELLDAQARVTALQIIAESEGVTEDEKLALIAWRNYLVAMSRVDSSSPDGVAWPERPDGGR